VGENVGSPDGAIVGDAVGSGVIAFAPYVGIKVGLPEGAIVGTTVGKKVGVPAT